MEQITTALSEASLRKGETERLKEDLAVNEKATQSRKGDIEQVRKQNGMLMFVHLFLTPHRGEIG